MGGLVIESRLVNSVRIPHSPAYPDDWIRAHSQASDKLDQLARTRAPTIGSTEPDPAIKGMVWIDTSDSVPRYKVHDGTDFTTYGWPAYQPPNFERTTPVAISNSTAWTSLIDYTTSAGDLYYRRLRLQCPFQFFNNSGGTRAIDFRFRITSTDYYDASSGNVIFNHATTIRAGAIDFTLFGYGSTVDLWGFCHLGRIGTAPTTGIGPFAAGGQVSGPMLGQATGLSLESGTFRLLAQVSLSTASASFTLDSPSAIGWWQA